LHLGVILAVAAAVSIGLIIVLKPWLARYAVARPNARSSHKIPTPQGGGIAVVLATFAGVLLALAVLEGPSLREVWPLAAAALLLAVVGAVDDIRTIAIAPRLALQFLAVMILVASLPVDLQAVPWLPWWLERASLVLAGMYFVNIVNFMDGIDWMSVAEVVPLAGAVVLLGAFAGLSPAAVAVATALAGGMLGFAPFNRPVARLFLGDVGSLPIGLILFWLMLQLALHGHLVAALLLPLYYLADATATLVRRLLNGENITQAHRTHFYQRALGKGWSVLRVVGRVFGLNLWLAVLAAVTIIRPTLPVAIASLVLAVLAVIGVLQRFARQAPRKAIDARL